MKLGARMLKTGVAITLALYAATLLGLTPVFAAIGAAFSMRQSVYQSYIGLMDQVKGNVVGLVVAITMFYTFGTEPIIIGVSAILTIGLCVSLKIRESVIAIVSLVSVMENTSDMDFLPFALLRFSTLTLGILSAFFVNLVFLPPKYEVVLLQKIDQFSTEILQWLRVATRSWSDQPALKDEISRIESEIQKIDDIYTRFTEERTYTKKQKLVKARKLVVFRQLITTLKQSHGILKEVYDLGDKMTELPTRSSDTFVEELDKAIMSHEKLILSAMGRIKHQQEDSNFRETLDPDIPALVDLLIHVFENKENEEKMLFLPLASRLMEYHRELDRLKRLLNSYLKYHNEDSTVVMPKE